MKLPVKYCYEVEQIKITTTLTQTLTQTQDPTIFVVSIRFLAMHYTRPIMLINLHAQQINKVISHLLCRVVINCSVLWMFSL